MGHHYPINISGDMVGGNRIRLPRLKTETIIRITIKTYSPYPGRMLRKQFLS